MCLLLSRCFPSPFLPIRRSVDRVTSSPVLSSWRLSLPFLKPHGRSSCPARHGKKTTEAPETPSLRSSHTPLENGSETVPRPERADSSRSEATGTTTETVPERRTVTRRTTQTDVLPSCGDSSAPHLLSRTVPCCTSLAVYTPTQPTNQSTNLHSPPSVTTQPAPCCCLCVCVFVCVCVVFFFFSSRTDRRTDRRTVRPREIPTTIPHYWVFFLKGIGRDERGVGGETCGLTRRETGRDGNVGRMWWWW